VLPGVHLLFLLLLLWGVHLLGMVPLPVARELLPVTGLFLSNESTVGPAIDLLALVLRDAATDRR